MAAITTLDTKTSSFFDHRDPEMVKRLARGNWMLMGEGIGHNLSVLPTGHLGLNRL